MTRTMTQKCRKKENVNGVMTPECDSFCKMYLKEDKFIIELKIDSEVTSTRQPPPVEDPGVPAAAAV